VGKGQLAKCILYFAKKLKTYYLKFNTQYMQIRFQNSPKETATMNTQELRENFLIQGLMQKGMVQLTYTHTMTE
jgi:hypothetical protein